MEPTESTTRPPQPTKADPTSAPTDAELSRIAREAVRQPADPRLDKQLERMGLTDAPAAAPPVSPPSAPIASDPAAEALSRRVGRVESIVWVLVVAVGVLAVAVVVLLLR